jgi:SAM-dependent methyltransferase
MTTTLSPADHVSAGDFHLRADAMNPSEAPSASSSGVAAVVQSFYERYPYPGPVDSLDTYRQLWQDPQRRRADHHIFQPAQPYREDPRILIAGCGTSQAAKHAIRWPNAQVTGIDFSATSIGCTETLKHKYKLDNLQLQQLPVERALELGLQFDQIVCTGVLHHLPDPDAGLRALRSVLKPDGVLHLMLYAPYGRTGIYLLQDFCRRLGLTASDEDIGELMTALKSLPPGHPLEHLLRQAPDFKHAAAVADALLNPQDRAYSVPQLFDFLAQGGMRFGRWLHQAPYSPHCGVLATVPQARRIAGLAPADGFAAVELFRGTMAMHSVVAYRDDHPGGSSQPGFAGDAWQGYVPIRLPDTICVQERLPPGAAAVLINRSHTYRDLVMVIDAQEKRLFDAVDGRRTLGEIASGVPPEMARNFFERLWWWDQVVFDTSRHPAG